jgi:hypothetical protein
VAELAKISASAGSRAPRKPPRPPADTPPRRATSPTALTLPAWAVVEVFVSNKLESARVAPRHTGGRGARTRRLQRQSRAQSLTWPPSIPTTIHTIPAPTRKQAASTVAVEEARLANDVDMTMRAFVLDALRAKGLDVRPDDLVDLRKDRR